MGATAQSITIAAPREAVFAVVTDFARYPEFLPEIVRAMIAARRGNRIDVAFDAKIFTALTYTLRFTLRAPEAVSWTLVEGQIMRKNEGQWELRAVSPRATEATYSVDLDLGPFVPSLVASTLAGSTLPATLRRFKERIEGLQEVGSKTQDAGRKTQGAGRNSNTKCKEQSEKCKMNRGRNDRT